jgi:hypothetical protein
MMKINPHHYNTGSRPESLCLIAFVAENFATRT